MDDKERSGIHLITDERERQINEELWDSGHDDEHDEEEIAFAAVCYAMPTSARKMNSNGDAPYYWPWDSYYWKPSNRIRDLVKAAALIAAEIDRIQRQRRR